MPPGNKDETRESPRSRRRKTPRMGSLDTGNPTGAFKQVNRKTWSTRSGTKSKPRLYRVIYDSALEQKFYGTEMANERGLD